jgi:biopolymer transport protein ExbD
MLRSRTRGAGKKLTLQLTSLLDMFTIILVFLMVSFQADDQDFVLHAGLELPGSSAKSPFKPGVNVAITERWVVVEGQQVYELDGEGAADEAGYEAGKVEEIAAAVKETWDNRTKEGDEENVVTIQADKGLPYKTLNLVMRSAAHAGFFRFRLVVEKE